MEQFTDRQEGVLQYSHTEQCPPQNADPSAITIRRLSADQSPLAPPIAEDDRTPPPEQLALGLIWSYRNDYNPEGHVPPSELAEIRHFLTAMTEVINGRRSLAQLEQQLAPRVRTALQTRARLANPQGPNLHLRSVHAFTPAPGVVEACGTVDHGDRARALAARLQAEHPGWLCMALRLG